MVQEKTKAVRALLVTISISLFALACQPVAPTELAESERAQIVAEIEQTIEDYKDANLRLDLDAQMTFWSDSDEFVFAGDGTISGGYEWWADQMRNYDAQNESWDYWEMTNIHVAVLARDAASATLEFESSVQRVGGVTARQRGAWTYVFKKQDGSWKVIQTNGTHVEF